ncbi:5-formyltetrahydrofolate cyclo-ligase [Shewanella sp. CG12_big_fil_rev_8_21_14_0_65_47_15]|uniref:5-formyltetrahydrofolate cyclo-ligase n=1 Tax=Shewanella sp. CG12_big_fil_rev_8_21_14_0_65_47_15 TaxID=1975537 RepID=UPI000CB22AC9|nr:5-formyltetrahydrofolate cyclo-ligase [Shewanella sp. CG12_big_fil_rev_8_21_14_0_65_47_15]PIW59726.1 MAG: 5-formyltetrahydrofolate cyclo-ligase [Shewanella sp. CG12_big_fil_rev_8_21_14_0_65_47_15]
MVISAKTSDSSFSTVGASLPTATKTNRDQLRKTIRAARKSLSATEQSQASLSACQHMLDTLQTKKAQHVALYLTHDGELATPPLVEALWQRGIQTYLPRLHPFNAGQLLFLHYTPDTPMQPNQFGILEPQLDVRAIMPIERLDVVITPLVAFDLKGNRMGMGGGYYDRTLANWQQKGKPLPMGYAHDCQQVTSLPCEHWDVPLPFIITPSRVLTF